MPGRATKLVNGEYYHIFNRGSDKRDLFLSNKDFQRLQQTFYYYQFKGPKIKLSKFLKSRTIPFQPLNDQKLVEIICYCLMPNHFHFLVRQLKDNGIAIFISQLSNSYTRYFNTKNNRVGPLLQGVFKSVHVESDEQLIHLSRYVHLNPVVSGISQKLDSYRWSSYHEYINQKPGYCSTQDVLNLFPSTFAYVQFLNDQIDYARSLDLLKHHLFDHDD